MLKNKVLTYLQENVFARERRNKDRAIAHMLVERYPALENVGRETLIAAFQDYDSMNRYWRLCLMENPELRGSDWTTREKMEYRAQENLGYIHEKTAPLFQ